jgi:hypothetical protein
MKELRHKRKMVKKFGSTGMNLLKLTLLDQRADKILF